MSSIYVLREQLQNLYAKYSMIADKVLQFLLAFFTFFFINSNIGFVKAAASPMIAFILAIICTFIPTVFTVVIAAVLTLVHMSGLSLGVMGVTAVIFAIMFVFYFRFTPKRAVIVLLVPLAFFFKAPYIVPIGLGLAATPVTIVPLIFGTIVYFMIHYIKSSATAIAAAGNIMEEISLVMQQILKNKELWVTVIAFTLCVFVVYALRRQSFDHAWSISIIAGAVANIIVMVTGSVAMNVPVSYGTLVVGSIISVALAFVLELVLFSVDYTRSERLEYEDDDYYYYVKAIPKISVAAPEKTVKRINERQPTDAINSEEVQRNAEHRRRRPAGGQPNRSPAKAEPRGHEAEEVREREMTPDEILLKRSLEEELKL